MARQRLYHYLEVEISLARLADQLTDVISDTVEAVPCKISNGLNPKLKRHLVYEFPTVKAQNEAHRSIAQALNSRFPTDVITVKHTTTSERIKQKKPPRLALMVDAASMNAAAFGY